MLRLGRRLFVRWMGSRFSSARCDYLQRMLYREHSRRWDKRNCQAGDASHMLHPGVHQTRFATVVHEGLDEADKKQKIC